jgi:hypothetical protein
MALKISNAARTAACNGIVDLIDGGSSAGTLTFRTGSAPTNTTDADSGTLLATLTFSDPAFGAASAGVATASTITSDTSIDATGTVGHFRIKDSDGTVIMQGSVTATGGGGDITFAAIAWVAGGTCSVSSLTVTVPASA